MTEPGPTRQEFTTQVDRLYDALSASKQDLTEQLRVGFTGTHGRLDTINGRTRDLEVRVGSLPCVTGASCPVVAPPLAASLTRREGGIVAFLFIIIALLLEAVRALGGPLLSKMLSVISSLKPV